ncbi:MAG: type II toxin-antitoxin system HicB family antitoxin [Alphaproteobacteria bacterium]|nr:type II toxin-antitoxin system HicB family antitoxin [Alphaproteobacteria bacterium]
MARRLYPAVLEYGARNTFAVWLPDFPECVAGGHTREEAIEKAELLVAQAVDKLAERESALPDPTPLERIEMPKGARFVAFFLIGVEPPDPSERVNVYLPKSLIVRADKRAAEMGMSRSSFFGFAVSAAIGWRSLGGSLMGLEAPRSTAKVSEKPQGRNVPREGAKDAKKKRD